MPVIEIVSSREVQIDGRKTGDITSTIANNPALARDIQAAIEVYIAKLNNTASTANQVALTAQSQTGVLREVVKRDEKALADAALMYQAQIAKLDEELEALKNSPQPDQPAGIFGGLTFAAWERQFKQKLITELRPPETQHTFLAGLKANFRHSGTGVQVANSTKQPLQIDGLLNGNTANTIPFQIWDPLTSKITPNNTDLHFMVRIQLNAKPSASNTTLYVEVGVGNNNAVIIFPGQQVLPVMDKKPYSFWQPLFTSQGFLESGGLVTISADNPVEISNASIYFIILGGHA